MFETDPYSELIHRGSGPMVVVTAFDGRERAGCLAGFHSQCGIEPLQHAVWLSKANHTFRVAVHAEHLAVHLLDAGDQDLARHFGESTGDDVDKFAGIEWTDGPGGTPLLAGAPNRFLGRRMAMLDVGGDHACFVLSIEEAEIAEEYRPLGLADLDGLEPGHDVEERPTPAQVRDPSV